MTSSLTPHNEKNKGVTRPGEQPAEGKTAESAEAEGWEVRLAPIAEHYVHIDLMVSMLAPKLAAVCLDTTDEGIVDWLEAKKIEIVPVSYRDTMALGCNVMALGNERVFSAAHSKDLNAKLRAQGFAVYDPDVTMFTMGGGGVHCLSQPLRRDPV